MSTKIYIERFFQKAGMQGLTSKEDTELSRLWNMNEGPQQINRIRYCGQVKMNGYVVVCYIFLQIDSEDCVIAKGGSHVTLATIFAEEVGFQTIELPARAMAVLQGTVLEFDDTVTGIVDRADGLINRLRDLVRIQLILEGSKNTV